MNSKAIIYLAVGAIAGPMLMGLTKVLIFAIGLIAIIGGVLFSIGSKEEESR